MKLFVLLILLFIPIIFQFNLGNKSLNGFIKLPFLLIIGLSLVLCYITGFIAWLILQIFLPIYYVLLPAIIILGIILLQVILHFQDK
jgi:hypothetical protein